MPWIRRLFLCPHRSAPVSQNAQHLQHPFQRYWFKTNHPRLRVLKLTPSTRAHLRGHTSNRLSTPCVMCKCTPHVAPQLCVTWYNQCAPMLDLNRDMVWIQGLVRVRTVSQTNRRACNTCAMNWTLSHSDTERLDLLVMAKQTPAWRYNTYR